MPKSLPRRGVGTLLRTAFAQPKIRPCARQGCQHPVLASSKHKSCPHCYQFHHYTSTINLGMAIQLAPSDTLIALRVACLGLARPGTHAIADAITAELTRRTFEGV